MSCIPSKWPNELCVIAPFVKCLERIQRERYKPPSLPDVENRNTPQPDALYETEATSRRLAIERTSIHYPQDFTKLHKYDHKFIEDLSSCLPVEIQGGAYVLELESLSAGPFRELEGNARNLSSCVEKQLATLLKQGRIDIEVDGKHYHFRKRDWRDDDDTAEVHGLEFRFRINKLRYSPIKSPFKEYLDAKIINILDETERKFQDYENVQRVLLIELHGDVAFSARKDWREYFQRYPNKIPVDEIWETYLDSEYSEEAYWFYEKFYPCDETYSNIASEVIIPFNCCGRVSSLSRR